MTILLSLKFWLVVQLFIDLVLVGFFLVLLGRQKSHHKEKKNRGKDVAEKTVIQGRASGGEEENLPAAQEAGHTASRIIDMLEPLVREADAAAATFDGQIRDKKKIIQGLNNTLDSRIISINLLLSRAESLLTRASNLSFVQDKEMGVSGKGDGKDGFRDWNRALKYPEDDVFDQQKSIVELFEKGLDADAIALRLSMPKGEVQLVISLKKKFMEMETR